MNKYLAWFITFNFINFSWIFFRANQWDDAIKVLKGMVGANGVVLYYKWELKMGFLKYFNVTFGYWLENINAKNNVIGWIIFAFIIILLTRNSIYYLNQYKIKFDKTKLIFSIILFVYSILNLNKISEFLYFNF
jgi:hypothetical protein